MFLFNLCVCLFVKIIKEYFEGIFFNNELIDGFNIIRLYFF